MNELVLKRRLLLGFSRSVGESLKVFVVLFALYKYFGASIDWHVIHVVCVVAWTYEMGGVLVTLFWLRDDSEP